MHLCCCDCFLQQGIRVAYVCLSQQTKMHPTLIVARSPCEERRLGSDKGKSLPLLSYVFFASERDLVRNGIFTSTTASCLHQWGFQPNHAAHVEIALSEPTCLVLRALSSLSKLGCKKVVAADMVSGLASVRLVCPSLFHC